jgi:hypothetical protein
MSKAGAALETPLMNYFAVVVRQPNSDDIDPAAGSRRVNSHAKYWLLCSEADGVLMFLAIVGNVKGLAAVPEKSGTDAFLLPKDLPVSRCVGRHRDVQRERCFDNFIGQAETEMRVSASAVYAQHTLGD